MAAHLLKLYIVVINIGFLTSNPGQCPIFPVVGNRHKSCYLKDNCFQDSECKKTQKCCENPCGINRCYEVDQDPLQNIEKCPIINEGIGCQQTKTKFCYANDCNRCCLHKNKCNPASILLTNAETCYDEICSRHKCKQQGEECLVSESNHKPYCICIKKCISERNYVCATDARNTKTFLNECYMNKEACDQKKTWKLLYKGMCVTRPVPVRPVRKPILKIPKGPYNLSTSITVDCYGDRERVKLKWIQKRQDGMEVKVPPSMLVRRGLFKINGFERKVLGLQITNIGYGSYGTYSCKQYFNKTWLEESFNLRLPDKLIFNRSSCNLSPDRGQCYGQFYNYYYDSKERKCQMFTYNGCGGNANNFQTREECEMSCAGKLPKSGKTYSIHRGEKCGRKRCMFFATCKHDARNNRSSCECPESCSLMRDAVCASDGKTYPSICFMKTIACRWRLHLVVLYKGDCVTSSTKSTGELSTRPIAPTKATSTPATKLKDLCKLKSCPPYATCFINLFTQTPYCSCPTTCSFLPNQVCASNMETYRNKCFMQIASCKKNVKHTVRHGGPCKFSRYDKRVKS